ncbi:MAG: ATP-binding protein [Candidatus Thermoplasmatota archaeon]|nr:ATP-binding protein [Candidatus Thermoplasmatota archaeon]
MIRHRLPVNVYQYKPTISGLPIGDLLVVLIILCATILASRFSLVASACILSVSLIFFFINARNDKHPVIFWPVTMKKHREGPIEADFKEFNGHLVVLVSSEISVYFHVSAMDILSMREASQSDIIKGVADALNKIQSRVDFLSMHEDEFNGFKHAPFHSFIRIAMKIDGNYTGGTSEKLLESAYELIRLFSNAGFRLTEINKKDELRRILLKLAGISSRTEETESSRKVGGPKDKQEFFHFSNFAKTNRYISEIEIRNANYFSGPFYLAHLECMRIPFDIIISLRRIPVTNQLKYVNRLLAERKVEYRFTRGLSKETEHLKRQISDLQDIAENVEKSRSQIFDIAITVRVFADHPAILNARLQRIQTSLEMIGFQASRENAQIIRKLMNFSMIPSKSKYLMDSESIAGILPIYRDEQYDTDGIIIGIDDLSERAVWYNPFSQNSYNSLVIGETGSGKSYFTKMFLMRSLNFNVTNKAIIFDPLNEYDCGSFDQSCDEFTIETYLKSGVERSNADPTGRKLVQDPSIKIIKPRYEEIESDEEIGAFLLAINQEMSNNKSRNILIIIDESHIIMRNPKNTKLLGTMVRHSRHYKTSIMNISQNTDDFLSRSSSNIAYNSNRLFIFRTRNINESHKKVLKIDGFDIPKPESLAGGNRHPYSECIVSDGTYCKTLRIITSDEEDKLMKKSTSS